MMSRNPYEHLSAGEWQTIQKSLKRVLQDEIAAAEPLGLVYSGPSWWVDVSHKVCGGCGDRMLRIRIKGHPCSPFYACQACGYVQEYWWLTGDPPPPSER